MDDRPSLDRFVDEESARSPFASSRVVAWPAWLRLTVGVALDTVFLSCIGGLLLVVESQAAKPDRGSVAFALGIGGLMLYGWTVYWAIAPVRAVQSAVRSTAAYPTNAPGYRLEGPKQSRDQCGIVTRSVTSAGSSRGA